MSEAQVRRRVLVTGAAGMLGSQVLLTTPDGVDVLGTDLAEAPGVDVPGLDLTDDKAIASFFKEHGPFRGVIHTAAFTAVDKAEEEEELAERVNGLAPGLLAAACASVGIPMVLVSTDFVFDGEADEPYAEDAEPRPLSAYGRTKLSGELQATAAHPAGVRIVRTQWLYGPRGKHFPGTMKSLAAERDNLRVVHDQTGSPTSTLELAPALWDVLEKGAAGIYHAACDGACTWFDLAVATLELSGVEGVTVDPCTTDEFPRPAHRPRYSVLACGRLAELRGGPLTPWRDALKTYLGAEAVDV